MKALAMVLVLMVTLGALTAGASAQQERPIPPWNYPPVTVDEAKAVRQPCVIVDVLANDYDPEATILSLGGIAYVSGGTATEASMERIEFCFDPGQRLGRVAYMAMDAQGMPGGLGWLTVRWL